MPTTYAHYRFGQTVYNRLPEREKKMIRLYRPLFDIGLHGPDILFYYRPFTSNPVNQLGSSMHKCTGRSVFTQAGVRILSERNRMPLLAYTYGFLCHFVLDSTCHGYIAEKIQESGVSHAEIEAEFDRALMIHDGHNPVSHCVTGHLRPSKSSAAVISRFFSNVTETEAYVSLQSMVRYLNLLTAPSYLKRGVIYSVLTCTGNRGMCDLIVNYRQNPACIDSTERLVRLYQLAQPKAVEAIASYLQVIHGEREYDDLFRLTFDPEPGEGIKIK